MAKRIITISREFGSGGRFIGEEVAKKLGIAYYDNRYYERADGVYDEHSSVSKSADHGDLIVGDDTSSE